jgi:diguanylate cyclase (GGDEF)-like protein
MNKTNFASEYLQHQVNDNYPRFIVTSYITALIGILFIFRNLYRSEAGLNDEFSNMYLYTWVFLVVNSILLRIALPLAKRSKNIKLTDLVMFLFACAMCAVSANITALDSRIDSDFTAYAFTILGTATAFRAISEKYLAIMLFTLIYFCFTYFIWLGNDFRVSFLVPILAISTISFFIAVSLENNRKKMVHLSIELEQTNQKLKEESIRDPLTKLYNRRYLTDFLQREIKEFHRSREPFCVAVCDLDHFKRVNDTLGHLTGDKTLIQFAQLLVETSRATDILIRFGGEEFVIVMPRTTAKAAQVVVDRIKTNIEHTKFEELPWSLSASFGLTEIRHNDTDNLLLARADDLLYQAKQAGRNRVVCDQVQSEIQSA